jgi:predicted ATPase
MILALLWLGYPDRALQRYREALALAQELSHPYTLARTLTFTGIFHQFRREGQQAQEVAETIMTLATDQGFPHWLAWGIILRGWALAEQRKSVEGLAELRQGLAAYRTTGSELQWPHLLALLAEAYGKGGQADEGLCVLAEAGATVEKTGERFYEAELYRLKGELLLAQEGKGQKWGEAEESFWHALAVARRQQAKSLELRAAMSLSRLWQRQGKQDEARQLLAEVYGWFTEGFETADLREARRCLISCRDLYIQPETSTPERSGPFSHERLPSTSQFRSRRTVSRHTCHCAACNKAKIFRYPHRG